MSTRLTIRDETTGGQCLGETVVEFLTERITLRELIRSRVYQEAQDFNARQGDRFNGLVQPAEAELALNAPRARKAQPVDWKEQFQRALEAFEQKRVLILVDDRQIDDLDQEILIAPATRVSFLRLVLLVGG